MGASLPTTNPRKECSACAVKFSVPAAEFSTVSVRVLHITATPAWQLDPLVQQIARLEAHDVETMLVNRHAVVLQHDPDSSGVYEAAANDPSEERLLKRLMRIGDSFDPDVVHIHDPHDPDLALVCRAMSGFPVSRVLEVRRSSPLPDHVEALMPSTVIVPSPELRRGHQALRSDSADFRLVADTCVHPGSLNRAKVRQHDLIGHRPLVVCDGSSAFGDDLHAIRLCSHLSARDPAVVMAVWVPEVRRPQLRRAARRMGVSDSQLLFFSPENGPELDDLLGAADLALSYGGETPWIGSIPFCLRALAAGTPIMTEFQCWVTDTVRAAGAGAFLDEDLTWATIEICRKLRDPVWRTEAGHRARGLASHHAFDHIRGDASLLDAYRLTADIEKAA